ncbi:MAG: hypothetical protein AAGH64_09505, partial [Planctomycetota bacterium]
MPRTTALLGLATLLAFAGVATADNEMRLIDEERELYRATFEGGTLTDFVEMLQEGLDGRVMFIAPERGDEIGMPRFDIANVDATSIVSLAEVIARVPVIEVESHLPIDIGVGEGVPVFVFDTRSVLPAVRPQRVPDTITELRFPGGTVRRYVDALKEAGAEGRIVITGDDRDIPMQPVTLRNVTLESAVELLDNIRDYDANRVTTLLVGENNGLYRVHAETTPRGGDTERISRVWSLRRITSQGLDDDTLLAAIEAGAETLDDANTPTLRYHEPTALLIANGTPDALGLIDAIIGGLTDSAIAGSEIVTGEERMEQYAGLLRRHIERLKTKEALLRDEANAKLARAASLAERKDEMQARGESVFLNREFSEIASLDSDAVRLSQEADELAFEIDGERT